MAGRNAKSIKEVNVLGEETLCIFDKKGNEYKSKISNIKNYILKDEKVVQEKMHEEHTKIIQENVKTINAQKEIIEDLIVRIDILEEE